MPAPHIQSRIIQAGRAGGGGIRGWRLRVTATPIGSILAMSELQFRASIGGANLITNGILAVSSNFDAVGQPKSNLLDGNALSWWAGASGSFPYTLTVVFPAPTTIAQVMIQARVAGSEQSPQDFTVEASVDGVAGWVVRRTLVGEVLWGDGEIRTYTIP